MSWESWGRSLERGPFSFGLKVFFACLLFLCVTSTCLFPVACMGRWFHSGTTVFHKEFSPEALLKKYEWFKDVSAQLDKKQADIKIYEQRFHDLKTSYGENTPRSKWSRDDREAYNQWASELAGVKASYNSLAAEYNSAMSKENWRFCDVGTLPKGADRPLPREYKPYESR